MASFFRIMLVKHNLFRVLALNLVDLVIECLNWEFFLNHSAFRLDWVSLFIVLFVLFISVCI